VIRQDRRAWRDGIATGRAPSKGTAGAVCVGARGEVVRCRAGRPYSQAAGPLHSIGPSVVIPWRAALHIQGEEATVACGRRTSRGGRQTAGGTHTPHSPTRRWSSASARGSCARGLPGRAVPSFSPARILQGTGRGSALPGARRGGSVGARCRERSAAHPRLPPCHTRSITVVVVRSARKRRCQR
jgi:hypothetical protein